MLSGVLKRFGRHSTKDEKVFVMRSQTVAGNKVLFNRAKRALLIEEFLSTATDEEKNSFLADFDKVVDMLHRYAGISERLVVLIDNNVLQDIAKRNSDRKRLQRFVSLQAALLLAQEYYMLELFGCISPAILYEWAGKKLIASEQDAKGVFYSASDTIAEMGLVTHRAGFNGFNQLPKLFKLIRTDEEQIQVALRSVADTSWQRDFESKSGLGGTRIPFGMAEDECPEVSLRYFNPWTVKFLVMHMIEKGMYRENKEQPRARSHMVFGGTTAFGVLKAKSKGVEGLGDIELLSYCDLTSQTMSHSPDITMALTFDDKLLASLRLRYGAATLGASVQGGSAEVSDFSRTMAWSMRNSARRNQKSIMQMQGFKKDFDEFWEDILLKHFPHN